MLCTQCPISPSRGAAGWSCPSLAPAFERRLRRSQVAPPSSVAKTPAAEMPIQSFSGLAGSEQDRVQDEARGAGIPACGGRVIGQGLDPLPGLAAIEAPQQARGLGSGVEPAVGVTQRPDLGKAVAEGQRRVGPADHAGEVRVVGRPVVHRALGEPGDLPALAAVVRAPDARAVPVAAATGPDRPGRRVADEVVDRPAVAVRTRYLPAAAVATARDQEGTLGRPDEDRDVVRSHGTTPAAPRQDSIRRSGRLGAGLLGICGRGREPSSGSEVGLQSTSIDHCPTDGTGPSWRGSYAGGRSARLSQ